MKFFFFVLIIFSFANKSFGEDNTTIGELSSYFKNIEEFHSPFLQVRDGEMSEGEFFLKKNRLRIEYKNPENILFVMKNKQVMFFNETLEEVHYFNPRNTPAQLFYDLFNKDDFFHGFAIKSQSRFTVISKKILIDDIEHDIKIFFGLEPLQIRKIEVNSGISRMAFTLLNPNFFPNFEDNLFSLANPLLN